MKPTIAASIFALSMLMMGGCSTMGESARVQPQDVDDAAYIAQVEQAARSRGVSVHWVNPPQKRVGTDL